MTTLKHIRTVAILWAVVCMSLVDLQTSLAQDHTTLRSYLEGSFFGWWESVNTPNGILYYNVGTGAGGVGRIDGAGNYTTLRSYPNGFFSTGWGHIVDTPNGILYYNSATGAGALGRIDGAGNHTTLRSYPNGSFPTGASHIVHTPNGILYSNAATGAGAVGRIN
jgi:streptogramin lyase